MNITKRIKSPTPTFFKKVRNTGIAVAAISAAIIKTPGMPQVVIDIASFLVAIGGTMGVISQATVKREA